MIFELQYTDTAGITQHKSFSSVGISDNMDVYMQNHHGEKTLLKDMLYPIVLEGAETLTESVRNIDDLLSSELVAQLPNKHQLDTEQLLMVAHKEIDAQTLPLKIALRMHEVMMHSIVNDGYSNVSTTHTPAVFKVEVDGRTRVGWHFEKTEQATLGARSHYDYGLSVSHQKNRDKEVVAVPPMTPAKLKARLASLPWKSDKILLLKKDGSFSGGTAHYMQADDSISINGWTVPFADIACATRMSDEQINALKYKVDTGYAEFDQQTNSILDGNVNDATYIARTIHPRDANGGTSDRQKADLISFGARDMGPFGKWVIDVVSELPEAQHASHQAYVFFTREDDTRKPFGAVILDSKRNVVAQISSQTPKHEIATAKLAVHLSNQEHQNKLTLRPLVTHENRESVLKNIAEQTMIRQYQALRQHLTERNGLVVGNKVETPAVATETSQNRPKRF